MTLKRPYAPAASGRLFGLVWLVVLTVPVAAAIVILLEFDLLSSSEDVAALAGASVVQGSDVATGSNAALGQSDLDDKSSLAGSDEAGSDEAGAAGAVAAEGPAADGVTELEPPDAPDAETEPASRPTLYVVQGGDTLAGIAQRFETSIAILTFYNDLANPDALWIGQELRIPPLDFQIPEAQPPPDDTLLPALP